MHPLLQEICRTPGVGSVQAICFNRWQRQLRDEIQPMLDELAELRAWKATADAEAALAPPEAVPVKRGPGRPRKLEVPA